MIKDMALILIVFTFAYFGFACLLGSDALSDQGLKSKKEPATKPHKKAGFMRFFDGFRK